MPRTKDALKTLATKQSSQCRVFQHNRSKAPIRSSDYSSLHLRSINDAPSRQMIITVGASDRFWPILLKNSLECERLAAMLKATRSSGRSEDDGTTVWRT